MARMSRKSKTLATKRDEHRVLLETIGDRIDQARSALDRLWKLHEQDFGKDEEYVRDGGFTDAGVRRLHALFSEGKRNMEIAEFFGVSDAAIAYRRKTYSRIAPFSKG
jgi:hypothetical protein